MAHPTKQIVVTCGALALIVSLLIGCAPGGAGGGSALPQTASPTGYRLTRCDGQQAVPTTSAPPPAAHPGIYTSSVSANSPAGRLYAFDPGNGSMRWCDQFVPQVTSKPCPRSCPALPGATPGKPLVAGGVVYLCVSGSSRYTYAFNASDGALRWVRQTDCWSVDIPFDHDAQPLLANGVLYSGSYALRAQDGQVLWRLALDARFGAIADGVIYAYSEQSVYALTEQDGSQRWSYALDAPIGDLPTVADGSVYVGDINGDSPPAITPGLPDTYALNATNGTLRWRYATGVIAGSSAAVVNGVVYIGSSEALYALEATTGKLLWRYQLGTGIESTPAVINGIVYFTSDGAYALNAADGTLRWHNTLGANQSTVSTPAAVMSGMVYLAEMDGSGHGTLYALSSSTGSEVWQDANIDQLSPPTVG